MSFEDIGRPEMNFSEVADFCEAHGIEYKLVKTSLAEVIFKTEMRATHAHFAPR